MEPPMFQFVWTDDLSPESFLLQAQFSQAFHTGEMLQSLHHLCGPSLDSLKFLYMFVSCTGGLRIWHGTLDGASSVLSRWKGSPCLTCWQLCLMQPSMPLAFFSQEHVTDSCPIGVHQDPQILFYRSFQLDGLQHVLVPCSSPGAGLCISCWTSWAFFLPCLQPAQVPLGSSTVLRYISHSFQALLISEQFRKQTPSNAFNILYDLYCLSWENI